MTNWETEMASLLETEKILKNFNVIDISFSSGHEMEVYVAISKEQRAQGLSYVQWLDTAGMLFVYSSPSQVPFSAKRMKINIDIAWYDKDGTLLQHSTAEAGDPTPLCCSSPFSYVLEAPEGMIPLNSKLKVRNG